MGVYGDLKNLLLRFPEDEKEFEKLVALAVEEVLGRRVWSARSSTQFGADMGTGNLEWRVVRVEAKRYEDGRNLKNEIFLVRSARRLPLATISTFGFLSLPPKFQSNWKRC